MTESDIVPKWSALSFRGRTVCYSVGGDTLEARELGSPQLLEVTPELRTAIEADLTRQDEKRREP